MLVRQCFAAVPVITQWLDYSHIAAFVKSLVLSVCVYVCLRHSENMYTYVCIVCTLFPNSIETCVNCVHMCACELCTSVCICTCMYVVYMYALCTGVCIVCYTHMYALTCVQTVCTDNVYTYVSIMSRVCVHSVVSIPYYVDTDSVDDYAACS